MENFKRETNDKAPSNGPQPSATVPAKRLLSPPLSSNSNNSTPDGLAMSEPLEYTEVIVPAKKANLLSPRKYQIELFEKARAGNIISVLDTGSGKTLIAIMLIKEMAAQERVEQEAQPKRLVSSIISHCNFDFVHPKGCYQLQIRCL